MVTLLRDLNDEHFAELTGISDCTPKEAARFAWRLVGTLAETLVGAIKLTVAWAIADVGRIIGRR